MTTTQEAGSKGGRNWWKKLTPHQKKAHLERLRKALAKARKEKKRKALALKAEALRTQPGFVPAARQ